MIELFTSTLRHEVKCWRESWHDPSSSLTKINLTFELKFHIHIFTLEPCGKIHPKVRTRLVKYSQHHPEEYGRVLKIHHSLIDFCRETGDFMVSKNYISETPPKRNWLYFAGGFPPKRCSLCAWGACGRGVQGCVLDLLWHLSIQCEGVVPWRWNSKNGVSYFTKEWPYA